MIFPRLPYPFQKEKDLMRRFASAFRSSALSTRWAPTILLLVLSLAARAAQAQSLGWEGPTGVFVTPLAYTSASPAKGLGQPSVAFHFLAAGPVIGEYSTVSITEGFAKRFEVGYTGEIHATGSTAGLSPLWNGGFSIVHGKATLVPENAFKTKWAPAIAVGGIVRVNDNNVGDGSAGQGTTNGDAYIVATKLVTQTKKVPLLLSAGLRGTDASLWGLGGNAPAFTGRAFGALGFVFTGPGKSTIILASEVAQQPRQINVGGTPSFDIPTSEVYAVRVVPLPKRKLNLDFGVLQAAGRIAPGVDLQARARVAFALSYGF
jgi:hypothetical protein